MLTTDRDALSRRLFALPKAELHVHLDGSLRPETMIELAEAAGAPLPSHDPAELRDRMRADGVVDLLAYLGRFEATLSVMQTPEALERITRELVIDHAAENVRWVEIRFSPILHTRQGLSLDAVMEAVVDGMRRGEGEAGIRAGLILCGLRSLDPGTSLAIAQTAVKYAGGSARPAVVAFDLAGAEAGNPASEHQAAFDCAAMGNLPITIHAGEAVGPDSIRDALHRCRAARLGHGTRLFEDPALEKWVRNRQVPLEICLTSNVQTRAVTSAEAHPVRRYFDLGIPLTLCTDNRLISDTTVTEEYRRAHEHLGFTWEELVAVARMGFEAAFLPWDEKRDLLAAFEAEISSPVPPTPRRSAPV